MSRIDLLSQLCRGLRTGHLTAKSKACQSWISGVVVSSAERYRDPLSFGLTLRGGCRTGHLTAKSNFALVMHHLTAS